MSTPIRIATHLVFWIISITISVSVFSWPYYEGYLWPFVRSVSLNNLSVIVYFYINYFILVPLFLYKGKYFLFFILVLLSSFVHIFIDNYLWNNTFSWDIFHARLFGAMTYECIYATVISTGFRMFELWDLSEEHKNKLERELKASELLFLQSQMSPHFLFNTLNNIYGLSLKNSSETHNSLSQLKRLMHYFDHFEKGVRIKIKSELMFLNAFIEINRLRNPGNINFSNNITAQQEDLSLEPMLLIPFIENAFKHGDLEKEIEIQLMVNNGSLRLRVTNYVMESKRKDAVGGIGIRNVKRRLELLYPGKHLIETYQQDRRFYSLITLPLV